MKDVSQLATRKLLDEMMFTEIDNFVNFFFVFFSLFLYECFEGFKTKRSEKFD